MDTVIAFTHGCTPMLAAIACSREAAVSGLTGAPTNWWYSAPSLIPASKATLSLAVTAIDLTVLPNTY